MAAHEETIMIGMDNSKWMRDYDRYRYAFQVSCIRSYARIKLESNPKNKIGLMTMGRGEDSKFFKPTSDLDKILKNLLYTPINTDGLDLVGGITFCMTMVFDYDEPKNKPKRLVLFTGGPSNMSIEDAEELGKEYKDKGIAVDVFNLYKPERDIYWDWKMSLDTLVATANNNDNSHIIHYNVDRSTRLRDILFSVTDIFPPLASRERPWIEEEEPKPRRTPGAYAAEALYFAHLKKSEMEPSSSSSSSRYEDTLLYGMVKLVKGKPIVK